MREAANSVWLRRRPRTRRLRDWDHGPRQDRLVRKVVRTIAVLGGKKVFAVRAAPVHVGHIVVIPQTCTCPVDPGKEIVSETSLACQRTSALESRGLTVRDTVEWRDMGQCQSSLQRRCLGIPCRSRSLATYPRVSSHPIHTYICASAVRLLPSSDHAPPLVTSRSAPS
jgi:hypothetical protein